MEKNTLVIMGVRINGVSELICHLHTCMHTHTQTYLYRVKLHYIENTGIDRIALDNLN